jgi:hypothetical protein
VAFDSDWKPGSAYALTLTKGDVTIDGPGQVVTESEPFRRLAYTWHTALIHDLLKSFARRIFSDHKTAGD